MTVPHLVTISGIWVLGIVVSRAADCASGAEGLYTALAEKYAEITPDNTGATVLTTRAKQRSSCARCLRRNTVL